MRLLVPEKYKQCFGETWCVTTHNEPYVRVVPGFYDDPFQKLSNIMVLICENEVEEVQSLYSVTNRFPNCTRILFWIGDDSVPNFDQFQNFS